MNSTRRLQKRNGRAAHLQAVVNQVQGAVGALSAVGDLAKTIQELGKQIERVSLLVDALTEDNETLAAELEMQREVTLQLLSLQSCSLGAGLPSEHWRDREAQIRARLLERKATTDEQRTARLGDPDL